LEAELRTETKNLRIQLDKVGLLRKDLNSKDEQLKRREKEVHALLLKMEYMKIKIKGLEEEHEEKDQQMKVLETLRDTLLNENDLIQKINEGFVKKLKSSKEYTENLSNILNTRLKNAAFEAEDIKEIQEMQIVLKEKNYEREINLLKETNEALREEIKKEREEYKKIKEDYEKFLKNHEESIKNKFPSFEEAVDNMVKAALEQTKSSYEKEKSMLQRKLQKKVKIVKIIIEITSSFFV